MLGVPAMAAPVAPKAPAVGRSVADHALQVAMFDDGFGRGGRRFVGFYLVTNGLSSFALRTPLKTPLRIAIHVSVVGGHIAIACDKPLAQPPSRLPEPTTEAIDARVCGSARVSW